MNNISIKNIINSAIIFILLVTTIRYGNAQNQNSITLSAPESGIQLHTACQYVKLTPGYQYSGISGNYMYSNIDKSNMCDVSYLSGGGAGFSGNTPPPLDQSLAVGTINGTFDVNPNGAATYTIPLVIPPGTMGMVPNLSLDYNSQGGNGLLGTGWSLGGLSAITRTEQNFYNDGETAPVTLTNSDRFLLDGDRLILVPPSTTSDYGLDGTIYHTENESFQQVISHGQANGGPLWFEVDTKDGKILQFGNTTDSRIMACGSNQVLTWLLNSVTDNRGNYMNIHYIQDNANCQYYPDYIEYTGNASSSPVILPYNKVSFSYAIRGDKQTDYAAGYPENQNVLMTGIQMYAQGSLVHHYQLDYSMDQLYSHLAEITEYGSDGSSYNSTKINYHNNLSNPISVVSNNSVSNLATDPYYSIWTGIYNQADGILPRFLLCGDFNGTGQTSIVEEEPVNTYPVSSNGVNWSLIEGLGSSNAYTVTGGTNIDPWCGYLNGGGIAYYDDEDNPIVFDPDYGFPTAVPPLDMNGDGKDDLVFFSEISFQDVFQVYLSNGSGFSNTPIQFYGNGNVFVQPFIPVEGDFDGDGVPDLVIFYPITGNVVMFSLKNGVPVTHYYATTQILNAADQAADFAIEQAQRSAYAVDINGDGRKELLITGNNDVYVYNLNADGTISSPVPTNGKTYPNFGTDEYWYNGISPSTATVYPGDFNGDGKTDLLIYNNIGGYNLLTGNGGPSNNWYISYSNGTDFGPFVPATFIADNGPVYGYMFEPTFGIHQYYVADFNGDGKDDIIDQTWGYNNSDPQLNINGAQYNTFNSMNLNIYFGNGNATAGGGAFVQKTYTVSVPNSLGTIDQTLVGDFNGDGHKDLLVYNAAIGTSQLYTFDLNDQPDNGINKAIAISNGLNATTNITYNNLPALSANDELISYYEEGNSAVFPIQDIQWPIYVTEHVEQDNGNGTQNEIEYSYAGALNNIQGKGFLGFSFQQIHDFSTDRVIQNNYQFNNGYFDQIPLSTLSYNYSSAIIVDSKTYEYTTLTNPTGIAVSGPINGYNYDIHYNYLSQVVDNNELYGITNTSVITQDEDGNTTEVDNSNNAQTQNVYYTYTTVLNMGWNGQLFTCPYNCYSITTRLSPVEPPYNRSTVIFYNDYGQPIEKDDDVGLVTHYAYDDLGANIGNLSSVLVEGGVSPRTYSSTYDYPYRRFVIEETNPLGQQSHASYDNAYGNTLTTTDPNGLINRYAYDGFGRMTQMTMPTSEQVTVTRLWDNVSGLTNSLFYTTASALGEATQTNYYDKLGKVLRSQKNGFDGTNINTDITYYDDQQMATQSEPYYSGTPPVNTFAYDNFQRQSLITNPAGLSASYSFTYGQPTYTTVASGISAPTKTFSSTLDATGVTTQATDDGGNLTYVYASCGKVLSIGLPGTAQKELITYDEFGRPTQVNDPDLGITTYTYDALGEILNVADPTSNYTQTYDLLGRVLTSNESISGETNTYTYDNMTHGIGMLSSVVNTTPPNMWQTSLSMPTNTVTCTYAYDNFSRPKTKTEVIAGGTSTTMLSQYVYDNLNRLTQLTYPDGFVVNNTYNSYGYLNNIASNSASIWTCNTLNNYDELLSATQGDLGTVTKSYDGLGFLSTITATEPSGLVMAYTYSFNQQTGNPTSRIDMHGNEETFNYDNLDRLTQVINAATPVNNINMTYGAGGIIASKSDVGDYSYQAIQPHAVSAITNYTSIDPIDLQSTPIIKPLPPSPPQTPPNLYYTPFKKLSTITEGSSPTQYEMDYVYGGDHQRKVSYESYNGALTKTIIYGDAHDNITTSNNYQVDYIYSPDGLVAMNVNTNNTSNELYYVHTDHLGSIINVHNEGLSFDYNQSFDAWGNYREPGTWQYIASNQIAATYSTPDWLIRGYTGHEHLKNFGVINMNGRAYDPLFAQVMSPDPVTQFPTFSQGFERYSYCMNNPLKYTDPSGYMLDNEYIIDEETGQKTQISNAGGDEVDIIHYGYWETEGVNKGAFVYDRQEAIENVHTSSSNTYSELSDNFNCHGGYTAQQIDRQALYNYWSKVDFKHGQLLPEANFYEDAIRTAPNGTKVNATGYPATFAEIYRNNQVQADEDAFSWLDNPAEEISALNKIDMAAEKAILGSSEGAAKYSVYTGINTTTREVEYIGITGREPGIRFVEHLASGTNKANLFYSPFAQGLTKIDARILEQNLINQYGGVNGGQLLNQINSIAPKYWEGLGIH